MTVVLVHGPGSGAPARVVGWAVHLPDADPRPADVPSVLAGLIGSACPPEQAGSVLGRKGLLYKEPATRLALLAVHAALAASPPPGAATPTYDPVAPPARAPGPVQPDTAVVACGNFGNVETVVTVARAVRAGGVREVSPLAAPNASSNVLASTIALWFGLAGPNVMVCSGALAGLDGLDIAVRLLRTGRAGRVVLAGAEPGDEVARALHAGPGDRPLRAGGACVVLERAVAPTPVPGPADLVLGADGFDPGVIWGDTYGAQGVVSLALASGAVAAGRAGRVEVSCGDEHDGYRTARVWAS
ncbi:beta-ketoacyl synthase N-terminal-like domain-containing protein [Luedemannella helvata]|uniref:Beta-ketoacyl synthase-like N-terminal domain-containing protein n=1 Tax=Luedemannella helvata TaxID=349315 RepID=A0ABN2KV78_9ACTN